MFSDLTSWSGLVEGYSFQCQVEGTVCSVYDTNTTLRISQDRRILEKIDRFLASLTSKPYIPLFSEFGLEIKVSTYCKTFEMVEPSSSPSSFSIISRSLYAMPRIIGSNAYLIIEPQLVYELESWHVSLIAHQLVINQKQCKKETLLKIKIHGVEIGGPGIY